MSLPMRLELETPKPMTTQEELRVVRAAYARKPTPAMRSRLAALLTLDDDNAAVTELLESQPDLTAGEAILLGQAWFAPETPDGDQQAHAAASRALELSISPEARAAALALRGKAEIRLGDLETARQTLAEALALDPHNKDACKRMAALDLAAGDSDAVLALYANLAERGVAHSRLFAAGALAQARRGDRAQAIATLGADRFFSATKLKPPPGWDSIEQFNMALAEELLAHPELRYDRYGAASERTWRIDTMPSPAAPLTRLLIAAISEAILEHVATCIEDDHPWAKARPDNARLRSWCVITESTGFEHWHVHQFGWLSGSYYVRVPDTIVNGDTVDGCLSFGLPEDLAGADGATAFGSRIVRPESGLLLLFPSQTYHRTFPHGAPDQRICVAFDVRPLPSDPA
jgi:tetratricopeptide (TPR) repeat protein